LVGGHEKRAIVIVDYDPGWPARFEAERARVQRALGARVLRVEHIGSTAVPGLPAKPIIDLLVAVEDPDDDAATSAALESVGYELRVREPGHRSSAPPNATSTYTFGRTRILRSHAASASETACAVRPMTAAPMSGSNANGRT
jgi:GrpB-like predicted nucleotidyltransferase (UPF0157 family)